MVTWARPSTQDSRELLHGSLFHASGTFWACVSDSLALVSFSHVAPGYRGGWKLPLYLPRVSGGLCRWPHPQCALLFEIKGQERACETMSKDTNMNKKQTEDSDLHSRVCFLR